VLRDTKASFSFNNETANSKR